MADCSGKMGVLLLQGWAMLDKSCEDCNVPLMAPRSKDKEICCACNKDYKNLNEKKAAPTSKAEVVPKVAANS